MPTRTHRTLWAALAALILAADVLPPVHAGGYRVPWSRETTVQRLAKKIDKLERHIDEFGTVVAKHPDIWGDGRLTKYRVDIEKEMSKDLPNFQFLLQGTVSEADSAFLGEAIALQAIAGAPPLGLSGAVPNPDKTTQATSNPINITTQMIPVATNTSTTDPKPQDPKTDPNNLILRTAPGTPGFFNGTLANPNLTTPTSRGISIEPYAYLDQKKRYLEHLNLLRRQNESDDTSDSPGYSLNLVRLPISVQPGRKTSHGYGAEITFTATPHLSEQLLPDTMKGMVISDILENYAPILLEQIRFKSLHETTACDDSSNTTYAIRTATPPTNSNSPQAAFAVVNQEAKALIPVIAELIKKIAHTDRRPDNPLTVFDVKGILRDHLNTAYKILTSPAAQHLWHIHCDEQLTQYFKACQTEQICLRRTIFVNEFGLSVYGKTTNDIQSNDEFKSLWNFAWLIVLHSARINDLIRTDMENIAKTKNCPCVIADGMSFVGPHPDPAACAAFNEYVRCRWPVVVFALDPEIEEQNIGSSFSRRREVQLAAAIAASRGIISLQKLTRFVRRMELDVATIAVNRTQVAFSHGNDTFGWRFTPRLQPPLVNESNLKVITRDLLIGGPSRERMLKDTKLEPGIRECTAVVLMPSFVPYVTFDSRADWFRVDNPTCCVYRHCSKLPLEARLMDMEDSIELSQEITELRDLSQRCVKDAHKYRDGEVYRLMRAVDQLDRSLPLQTAQVQFPYDGDLSPTDLFERGTLRLAPRLEGWYGQPGINVSERGYQNTKLVSDLKDRATKLQADYYNAVLSPASKAEDITAKKNAMDTAVAALNAAITDSRNPQTPGTTLFLVGKHFSLFNMRIIAGGVDVTDSINLISRELCQVTIPANASTVTEKIPAPTPKDPENTKPQIVVDIHLATTYGLTSRLSVPVLSQPVATAAPKSDVATVSSIVPLNLSWEDSPEVHVTYFQKASPVEFSKPAFQNDKGPLEKIRIKIDGEAESLFGSTNTVKTVEFAAFLQDKTDKTLKVPLGPIFLKENCDRIEISPDQIGKLLGKISAAHFPETTKNWDLIGYIRTPGAKNRPTYKIDKSITVRIVVISAADAAQPSGAANSERDERELESEPVDLPAPIEEAPLQPHSLNGAQKPPGQANAAPKPSRRVVQTQWITTIAK